MDAKTKVLLVDDSQLARRTLRRILENGGYEVVETGDGARATECYLAENPAVVLLDLLMRGVDGFEVLKRLRQVDAAAKVVVVSADVQVSSRQMVRDLGATGFVPKPFTAEEVIEAVRTATAGGQAWS